MHSWMLPTTALARIQIHLYFPAFLGLPPHMSVDTEGPIDLA